MFHTRKRDENKHLFKVEGNISIFSKEEAQKMDFYLVQSTAKRYICVEVNLEKELDSSSLDPSKENIPYESNSERYDSQYVTFSSLIQRAK